MKILKYKCNALGDDDWEFSEVEFGSINLLVGDTATGKTRLLNTIFNIGTFVARDEYKTGFWDITFEQQGSTYRWLLRTDNLSNDESSRILEEKLWKLGNETTLLVERTENKFVFSKEKLPKLSPRITAISLLKEEEVIQPIHEGFGAIRRRRFFHDALLKVSELEPIPQDALKKFRPGLTERDLYKAKLGLNATLYILSIHNKEAFDSIRKNFKVAFPFIDDMQIQDFSKVSPGVTFPVEIPVFCIKEKSSTNWIPITEASSGMQKVLLILTDTYTLPPQSIYIIDEYENSLGINAIDFFPHFLLDIEKDIQFFITSHHPYIINEIPSRNWYVFNRKGKKVTIKYGEELERRFGKSKQQAFIQLINDPFYVDGVE